MSAPMPDSRFDREQRQRFIEKLEAIDGVVAATVDTSASGETRVRAAIRRQADPDAVRGRIVDTAGNAGLLVRPEMVSLGYMQADEGGLPLGSGAGKMPSGGADTVRPPADESTAGAGAADVAEPGSGEGQPPTDTQAAARPTDTQAAGKQPESPERGSHLRLVDDAGPPPPWHGRFLVLEGVDIERSDNRIRVSVHISRLGEAFVAEVEELDSPGARARAAARATIDAAEKAGVGISLSLEGVLLQEYFGRQHVIVFVEGVARRRFAHLAGILAVDQSVENASVLATLRAIERWLAW